MLLEQSCSSAWFLSLGVLEYSTPLEQALKYSSAICMTFLVFSTCKHSSRKPHYGNAVYVSKRKYTVTQMQSSMSSCLCALQSFLLQNRTASVTTEKTISPSDDSAPPKTPAGVSLSQLSQSAVSGLKDMSWTTTILLGVTGATAGVASGLLGIGGGTVVTPLLAILTPLSQVIIVTVQQTHRLDRRCQTRLLSLACKSVCTPEVHS